MTVTRRALSLSHRFGPRCMLRLVPLGAMLLLVAGCSSVQASHPSGAATTAQPTIARTSVPPAQAPASATAATQAAEPTIVPTEMPPAPDPGALEAALS